MKKIGIKPKKVVLIIIISLLFVFLCGFGFIYFQNDKKVAVLAYHGILPKELNTSGDNLVVDMETFESEIKLLKKAGYESMTLKDFYCWKNGECKKKHKSVLITFDDGYTNNYDYAFKILKKYDMNAVVFCVGSYIEKSKGTMYFSTEMLEEIKEKYPNIEIASHSYNLHFRSDKTYDEVDADVEVMDKMINSKYYAYPFGNYNDDYVKALKDNNYKLAFTFGPGKEYRKADIKDDNLKIPRLNVSNDMPIWKFIARVILPI